MAVHNVYLKIETIVGYSPVEPDDHVSPPIVYRRDCMRNMGHEDGTIPADGSDLPRISGQALFSAETRKNRRSRCE